MPSINMSSEVKSLIQNMLKQGMNRKAIAEALGGGVFTVSERSVAEAIKRFGLTNYTKGLEFSDEELRPVVERFSAIVVAQVLCVKEGVVRSLMSRLGVDAAGYRSFQRDREIAQCSARISVLRGDNG